MSCPIFPQHFPVLLEVANSFSCHVLNEFWLLDFQIVFEQIGFVRPQKPRQIMKMVGFSSTPYAVTSGQSPDIKKSKSDNLKNWLGYLDWTIHGAK